MHEVVRYCYEYQLLSEEARQGQLNAQQRERLQALGRLLADPENGERSYDRVTLRCAGTIDLSTGPEPICVLDIGAGGLSVVMTTAAELTINDGATVVISDVKRGIDYCFPCTVTRLESDPAGRRVGLLFAGKPVMQRRPGLAAAGKRDDDSMPRIDLRTFQRTPRQGLEEVMTPPGGTPRQPQVTPPYGTRSPSSPNVTGATPPGVSRSGNGTPRR